MNLKLSQLRIGKVDGKHEYLTPMSERDTLSFDAFLMPPVVDPQRLNNSDVFYVQGLRGTGKTSLLRWHANEQRKAGSLTNIVLFKSDLTEEQRLHISNEVGITWADVESKSMEVSQDFKAAWTWFILHQIGRIIRLNPDALPETSRALAAKVTMLLGLDDDSIFKKAIGFMPKLEGARVKVRSQLPFFEAELSGDFKKEGKDNREGSVSLDALSRKVLDHLAALKVDRPLYLYFDELEAFYLSPEQHRRDQRMVRDLLFAIAKTNDSLRSAGSSIHIIAAVRSEIVDAMGALGQEVGRLVHDRGFQISWHHANRSLQHPLIEIIRRKIEASEKAENITPSGDPIASYFPANVGGEDLAAFLLDRSFYKPRDLVWRLSVAQNLFPEVHKFSDKVLHDTEIKYSAELWNEVKYELSATYRDEEIAAIETALAGGSGSFESYDIEQRFEATAKFSKAMSGLLARRSPKEVLSDLYRIGAIGNSFRVGPSASKIVIRWSFRGDQALLVDKRMVIHPALFKRLSIVARRRRGSEGTRTRK